MVARVVEEMEVYDIYWNNRQCTMVHSSMDSTLVVAWSGDWGELLVLKVDGVYLFNVYRQPRVVGIVEQADEVLRRLPRDAIVIMGGDFNRHFGQLGWGGGARPSQHAPRATTKQVARF